MGYQHTCNDPETHEWYSTTCDDHLERRAMNAREQLALNAGPTEWRMALIADLECILRQRKALWEGLYETSL